MLKLTKKADYGLISMRHLACKSGTASAKDIADTYGIPLALLAKVLQSLVRNGLLVSEQGASGGYRLARDPREITTLEVIRSIDGPIILTHCFTEHSNHADCGQHSSCTVREPLRKVHEGILQLLSGITVSDLASDDMGIPSIPPMLLNIQPSRTTSHS